MKRTLLILALLLCSNPVFAQNSGYETISLFADICEKISPEETISQARVRASDKAVFSAVEHLQVLELPKKQFDQHDFNILVYKLIDNYIEDLNVRTVNQDQEKICIDVYGKIDGENIIKSVIETKEIADRRAAQRAEENLIGRSPLQTQKEIEKIVLQEAEITPLEPSDFKNQIIRIDEKTTKVEETTTYNDTEVFDTSMAYNPIYSPEIVVEDGNTFTVIAGVEDVAENVSELEKAKAEEDAKKGKVYVTSTKFFDSSVSHEHSKVLKDLISKSEYVILTDDREAADYVISPNILRIKVDAINNITNRMQMVVMVEMEDLYAGTNAIEHQNRFTLLSIEDDEQTVAGDLMNKLLEKAGAQILSKVESAERKRKNIKGLPKIITPGSN